MDHRALVGSLYLTPHGDVYRLRSYLPNFRGEAEMPPYTLMYRDGLATTVTALPDEATEIWGPASHAGPVTLQDILSALSAASRCRDPQWVADEDGMVTAVTFRGEALLAVEVRAPGGEGAALGDRVVDTSHEMVVRTYAHAAQFRERQALAEMGAHSVADLAGAVVTLEGTLP